MYCGVNWGHGTVLPQKSSFCILKVVYLKNFLCDSYETFRDFRTKEDLCHSKINFA